MEIEKLIIRYLMGEASEQEMTQMQEWLKASKENRLLFARHKKIWMGSKVFAVYDTAKRSQDSKMVDMKISNAELHKRLDKVNRRIRVFAYAASIALLVGITSIRYTAAIKEIPIEQVLEAISLSAPISYQIKGTEVILMENKAFKKQVKQYNNT